MEVTKVSKDHGPNGGFSEPFVIMEGKVKILDRKIGIEELEGLMIETGFKRFDRITTGWGSQKFNIDFTLGYGTKGCGILLEKNKDFVSHIWFDFHPACGPPERIVDLYNYIFEISNKWNLILVDWRLEVIIDSKERNSLMTYLNGDFEF